MQQKWNIRFGVGIKGNHLQGMGIANGYDSGHEGFAWSLPQPHCGALRGRRLERGCRKMQQAWAL